MLLNLVDKCLFGSLLIVFLQVPILADHYTQFISGSFDATKLQVEGYEATAAEHQFADVKAMIETHLNNPEASVRSDAKQKIATMQRFEDLKFALHIFTQGHIFQKAIYMFQPAHWDTFKKVWPNFKPGLPLSLEYFLYAFVIALLFSEGLVALLRLVLKRNAAKPTVLNTKKA